MSSVSNSDRYLDWGSLAESLHCFSEKFCAEHRSFGIRENMNFQNGYEKIVNNWLLQVRPNGRQSFSFFDFHNNIEFHKPCEKAAGKLFNEEILALTSDEGKKLHIRIIIFATLYLKEILGNEERRVIEYLQGRRELSELNITAKNAKGYLKFIKIIDLSLNYVSLLCGRQIKIKRSTDEIRTHILAIGSPSISTAEAYSKTISVEKMTSWAHLQRPDSWTASRNGHQAKWLANECAKAIGLAKRFRNPCPIMIVTQGNTAAGKSTAIIEEIEPMLKDNESTEGILNPDSCKALVKHTGNLKGVPLTNQQVHFEGYSVFENYHQEMAAKEMTCVVDKRFGLTLDKNHKPISCIDLDVPLRTSLIRNLLRDPFGKDPCVVLEAVTSGFMQIRTYRAKMMEIIRTEPQIKKYKLYHTDENGKKQLVAKKENGIFEIVSQSGFNECMRIPSAEEIEKVAKQEITPEFIDSVVGKDISVEQRPMLERWLGFTIEEALKRRVNGAL